MDRLLEISQLFLAQSRKSPSYPTLGTSHEDLTLDFFQKTTHGSPFEFVPQALSEPLQVELEEPPQVWRKFD